MYIHETKELSVLFSHTRCTLRYIWIGTPHVALVYTHLEATRCRTIDHRCMVTCDSIRRPISQNFQVMFLLFIIFFKIIGAATTAPVAPLPTPLQSDFRPNLNPTDPKVLIKY